MSEPLNSPYSYVKSVIEPMFRHDLIDTSFQNRFNLELKNIHDDPKYVGHITYPPEIDQNPDFLSSRPIQGNHIKTVKKGDVTASVFTTDKPGVYLIVRSRIDKIGKSTSFKSLTFVGKDKVQGYEEDPDDLKPLDK